MSFRVLQRIHILLCKYIYFYANLRQIQFKGSSRKIAQQVKQHEAQTLNEQCKSSVEKERF